MKGHCSIAWLLTPLVFVGGDVAMAAQTLYIGKTASYENIKKVRQIVREECAPETQLPLVMHEEIQKRTSIQVVATDEPLAAKNGLAITFSILSLNIPPSAGWTTEKRIMRVQSIVYRNGVMVADHVSYADSQGGGRLFNRMTCQIVDDLIRDIGVHTAEWIKAKKFQDAP